MPDVPHCSSLQVMQFDFCDTQLETWRETLPSVQHSAAAVLQGAGLHQNLQGPVTFWLLLRGQAVGSLSTASSLHPVHRLQLGLVLEDIKDQNQL